jgi:hypothetical protein
LENGCRAVAIGNQIPSATALDIRAINRRRKRAMRGANISVAVASGP